MESFDVDELHDEIATTGIVAVIHGNQKSDKKIALRADLDALDILEKILLITAQKIKENACLWPRWAYDYASWCRKIPF